jgi:FMN phosphatase YigB (HAD superfamily)
MATDNRHSGFEASAPRLISVDVFDTLLLRDLSSDRRRRREAATIAASRLGVRADAVARAWCSARRIASLAARVGAGCQTPLAVTAPAACRLLGLPHHRHHVLVEAFREAEAARLQPSVALCKLIAGWRRDGFRVIAISDTDFSSEALSRLIAEVAVPHLLDAVHTSADHGVDKRSGELFRAIGRQEGVAPGFWLHLGDDPVADVAAPRALGIKAIHRPRSLFRDRLGRLMARLDTALVPA